MIKELADYIKALQRELKITGTTEHSHRPALKTLIEAAGKDITATNEPERIECGAPDFRVSRRNLCIGYIETKDIGVSLHEAEHSDQLKRYLRSLPNLLLTDYLEFRWFVDGELRQKARIGDLTTDDTLWADEKSERAVLQLLDSFLDQPPLSVSRPRELATRMATFTHLMRDMIVEAFDKEKASQTLKDLRQAFARTLIHDLDAPEKTDEFADMYAQTIAYGLFAARCNHTPDKPFRRADAAREIPKTNPFLRKLFETITGVELDEELYADYVNDLVQLLDRAHMETILEEFGRRAKRDPVFHFYETFLRTYDPKLRELRGVYYTPEPVVSYIVRSVDHLLRKRFGLRAGFADETTLTFERRSGSGNNTPKKFTVPRVLILDPACGTGTFLYAVVDRIRDRFIDERNAGMWSGFVKDQLLPRLYGFELLMAPYAVAHFKLAMQLAALDLTQFERSKWAYDFSGSERLGIYLTNTLEEAEFAVETLYGPLRIISEEANAARAVKRDLPILVVMGNPPYSGHSANRSWEMKDGRKVPNFIGKLLADYYMVDGKPLGEKNPKWLQDDYVKFIRWGQWRIQETGAGILAFITNHSYLDNPTFRGMRQQLMNAFSEIYILDLHGNYKKKEVCPNGSKDENVFDIQQGVAIGIFVKSPEKSGPAKVHHAEIWGVRESPDKTGGKYVWLRHNHVASTKWAELEPESPFYVFKPQQKSLLKEYERGSKITEIMPVNSVGIVTARDKLTIGFSPDEVWEKAKDFASLAPEEARRKFNLGKDARDWKVELAQEDIRSSGPRCENIVAILYRPFDIRYTYYTGRSRGFICRPRPEVMRHMLHGPNVAFIATRQTRDKWDFLATNKVCAHKCCAAYDINTAFPFCLYPDPDKNGELFDNGAARHANLNLAFVDKVSDRFRLTFLPEGTGDLKKTFGPEDVFHYIYAVFHSPTYRERYGEFLKMDFPRVPLTSDRALFRELCAFGKKLVQLHLLESPVLDNPITRYPMPGNDVIEEDYPKYFSPDTPFVQGLPKPGVGRVYINSSEQLFTGVPPQVWEFQVGGYQVCEKWLKDRRGRKLTHEDLTHYQKVVTALNETIDLMAEIDKAIPKWPIG